MGAVPDATRSAFAESMGENKEPTTSSAVDSRKRKAAGEPTTPKKTPRAKKSKSSDKSIATPLISDVSIPPPPPPLQNVPEEETLVPAVLTFSFEEAKVHLIRADHRFEDIFAKLKCKPFEYLEQVHPFRALVQSILGQQISWLAARSINHRFVRLYDPSLPEKPADYSASKSPTSFFPAPYQVANTDIVTLKSAGLSTRKAEYVKDLAARFADGRLSTEKLLAADDKTLAEMLIEVRGIGQGDLGVQRGMLRWFLSRHSSKHTFTLSPHKLSDGEPNADKSEQTSTGIMGPPPTTPGPKITTGSQLTGDDNDALPTSSESQSQTPAQVGPADQSSNLFPKALSVANLKARLEGKKIKDFRRGAFLTPKEMEDLAASWAPYRSLGVYYMWALSEEKN
ncbi:DNA glycosylase [Suillus paluster]|uniref:DNA glycosylase n=1 Tax=Suillus paluster TaxID=48578 RepID=UPI001B86DE76|nr:DNA glycosylase [Suillus paluster]KAG1735118.1 DNA glycosylase [Suillus paluster]